jgi:hypothetical protein
LSTRRQKKKNKEKTMARRDRVPRHKSHNHKRNKNAKLSPFQREQKRAKLANQVPTARTIGDLDSIPHSQRHVSNYLQEKMKQQKEKRAKLALQLQQESEAAGKTTDASTSSSSTSSSSGSGNNSTQLSAAAPLSASGDAAAVAAPSPSTPSAKSLKKKAKVLYPSLNEELTASVGTALQPISRRHMTSDGSAATADTPTDPSAPRSIAEIIARKKERKHQRKQEARRARVAAKLEDMEAELEDYVKGLSNGHSGVGKKGRVKRGAGAEGVTERDRINATFERQLRTMAKNDERREAERQIALVAEKAATTSRKRRRTAASHDDDNNDGNNECDSDDATHARHHHGCKATNASEEAEAEAEAPPRQRKRISFNPEVVDPTAAQAARRTARSRKPQDFYELVDVVRYGERVEAPPVFDVVPNRNAAVSRLANQLERKEHGSSRRAGGADERHRLLSGGGQLGEQKRLVRLGLAPAITHTVRADTAASAAARMSKEEEIKALRDRVMATYQRNRRKEVVARKGVDMRHEFPKFA